MNEMKLREIAEKAIPYLYDNGLLEDFLEDQDIDLNESEMDYLLPDHEEEEEW